LREREREREREDNIAIHIDILDGVHALKSTHKQKYIYERAQREHINT
jgi:hypothetical protein